MIILLIVLAGLSAAILIGPAFTTLSKATKTDGGSRGPWGILDWDWRRTRKLDAHERRWQTALIGSSEQAIRWRDFVGEIERLERAAEMPSDPTPPPEFDRDWLTDRLERLEAHQNQPTSNQETPQT